MDPGVSVFMDHRLRDSVRSGGKGTLERIKLFLYLQFFFVLAWTIYHLLIAQKGSLVLYFQDWYSPVLNQVVKFITDLGTVPMITGTLLYCLIHYWRGWAPVILSLLVEGLAIFGLKEIFGLFRPSVVLAAENLQIVEGLSLHCCNSFPSGHTASAFAGVTVMLLVRSNIWLQLLGFILAAGISLSRVYLAQHFIEDVIAGSIIGVMVPIFIFWLWERRMKSRRPQDERV